jgi:pimeloyl-ACP methyl ester carboxylesterase
MIAYPVVVDGVLTRVLEAGAGARSVVFLHGGNSNANRWRATAERLSGSGFHLFAFDLPGHGFAIQRGDFPLGVPAFAAYLGGLLDALELDRPHLVGSSLGGHVAGMFVANQPDRVSGLTLVGPAGMKYWDLAERERIWRMNTNVSREGVETSLRHLVQGRTEPTAAEIDEEYRLKSNPQFRANMAVMAEYMTSARWEADLVADRLAKVTGSVPTFIIWGGDDHSFPADEWATEVHAALPGSRLAVIDGTGHNPHLERPDLFDPLLLDILHDRFGASGGGEVRYS